MAIDRNRLVGRHNPVLTAAHPTDVLTLGNGDIAFTVDASGLQTFAEFHELRPDPRRVVGDGIAGLPEQRSRSFDRDDFQIPLRTQSTWGWYRTRPTRELRREETVTVYDTARGAVPYEDRMGIQRAADPIAPQYEAGAWFHYNPRRAHLGRLALVGPNGAELQDPLLLVAPRTELDLWSGHVRAEYDIDDEKVVVTTTAHPQLHQLAVRIESALLDRGWGVAWVFDPQPDDLAPFEQTLASSTSWDARSAQHWTAFRRVEDAEYRVEAVTSGAWRRDRGESVTALTAGGVLEVVVTLAPGHESVDLDEPGASFEVVSRAAANWWESYWLSGAAVTFEGSIDARANELERRLVLSQYLLAVNSAGVTPPAETGLTYNTWAGKFHLEMHWWHAAHFPLWNRGHLLERSLPWYHGSLASARAAAQKQGYRGARWPKQTDPSAEESPSNIGVFLVWQQPHVIHLLELLRGEGRDEEFLRRHYPLIEATADFMVDLVEEHGGLYTLPSPLIPAQESYLASRETNADPTFELAYWAWALQVAADWRDLVGLPRRSDWDAVARSMRAPLIMDDGTYAGLATPPYLIRKDHPSMLMALGWLPETGLIDPVVMSATLESVWVNWDFQTTWGWDFPVMAMTAARLGDVERSLAALLMDTPKNVYLPNGHNPQMPGFLSLYLPANGGLLAATAHLVAAVGRGDDLPGGWRMLAEGFAPLPSGDRASVGR